MILLNFSHPLTTEQIEQIETLIGQKPERVISIKSQFDNERSFEPQLQDLMENIGLTSEELQTKSILVNLPSLNTIAALLLAELHGRMGYFPPILRLRPMVNTMPTQFEVIEILNLQNVREEARKER